MTDTDLKANIPEDGADERVIDLHTHSTASDGSCSPSELIRLAGDIGLSAIALTDHDCTDGIAQARREAEATGTKFIPGIELSVESDAETHIVGLFIDEREPELQKALKDIRLERLRRNREVESNLKALGMTVTVEEAREQAGSQLLCRAHFAKVMVKKGYAESVKDAFDRFLGPGRPAYSSTKGLKAVDAIRLIKNSGGVSVAAHLHHTKKEGAALEAYLAELKGYGLDAVEGYYSEYTPEMAKEYRALAAKLGLAISGGTDFHGKMKPHIALGRGFGDLRIPYSLLGELKKRTNK